METREGKMINHRLFFSFILLSLTFCSALFAQELEVLADQAWQFSAEQLDATIDEIRNNASRHPKITNSVQADGNGRWITSKRHGWTSGFFSGCLWLMYERTGNQAWLEKAEKWTADLESQKYNTGDHDVGFRMFCSYGNGVRINPNEKYKKVLLKSANSLSQRYNARIGCIKSWDWTGNFAVIIDNMMNLELLLWASKNGGENELADMAVNHADKTIENHVREDGSTYHVVDYNDDGSVNLKRTHQGYSDESTWSRGQSWGLYGYTMMYRETGEQRFLDTALLMADYVIENLPEDYVPYSDFDAPNIPDCEKDASAAAIACSALLELGQYSDNPVYLTTAENMLRSLIENYLAKGTDYSSILHRASQFWGDAERGTSYADYYFLEALSRYEKYESTVLAHNKKPLNFHLPPAFPNPFNACTTIEFECDHACLLKLEIFDATGRHVETLLDEHRTAGSHQIRWHANDYPSGVYLVRLSSGMEMLKQKILLVK